MRFEGGRWVLLPTLAAAVLIGLGLSVYLARETDAERDRRARALAVSLAEALAPRWPLLAPDELQARAAPLFEGHPEVAALTLRDAQGGSRLELRRDNPPAEGFWATFIRVTAPLPHALEAAIPGAPAALSAQPPAVRLRLQELAADATLHQRLNRLWLIVLGALGLAVPVWVLTLNRLARMQQTLLGAARTQAQGRHEARTASPTTEDSALLRQDLARERERLRALDQELNAARDLARQRGALIGSLAHELRTPLAALGGHVELLALQTTDAHAREPLALLRSATRQLSQQINDLLDWNRIENGQLALTRQPFDLAAEIEDSLRLLAPLAYEKNLELAHVIYHDVPSSLVGDAARLRQMLTNLLSNAIKFTSQGEIVLRVMKEREEAGRVRIALRVSDTGVGIAPEQKARLFLPYQRLHNTGAGGTGLGLVITRHLAERMGGGIEVESEPGRGSHFQINVWLEPVASAQRAAHSELQGLRIGLADLSAASRLALRHRLEFWGAPTHEFETAAALREALHSSPSSLDLLLVGLKPNDLTDASLQQLTGRGLPSLALVSAVGSQLRDRALSLGFSECLPKSASGDELASTLMRLSGRSATPAPAVLKGCRVLLAENNAANRAYLKALLETLGAQVDEATDGLQALKQAQTSPPDLALLDLHMPGLDGIGVARRLRAERTQRIPIIAISAHLEPEEQNALTLAGVDAILLKPFDATQLQRVAAPLLGRATADDSSAALLVEDPALRKLLSEELPVQLEELEQALRAGDAAVAREAAHQLHGSGAFYKLPLLKNAAATVETRLARGTMPEPVELEILRNAAAQTLSALKV